MFTDTPQIDIKATRRKVNQLMQQYEKSLMRKDIECDKENILRVNDVVRRLQGEYRQVFLLTYFHKKTNAEAAIELDISESNLNMKKRTAIELFAYGMGIEEYEETTRGD